MSGNSAAQSVTVQSHGDMAKKSPENSVAPLGTAEVTTRTRSEPTKPPDPAQGRSQFLKSNSASYANPKQAKKAAENKTKNAPAGMEVKSEDGNGRGQDQVSDESPARPKENKADAEVHADFPQARGVQDFATQLQQLPIFARIAAAGSVEEINQVVQQLAHEKHMAKRSAVKTVYCVWLDVEGADESKLRTKIRTLEPSILPTAMQPGQIVDDGKVKRVLHIQVQGLATRDAFVTAARRESIRLSACFLNGRCGCDPKVYPHTLELQEISELSIRNQAASSRPTGNKEDIATRISTWMTNKLSRVRIDRITVNLSAAGTRAYVLFNTGEDEDIALKEIMEVHGNKITLTNKASFQVKLKKKTHEQYFECVCGERGHGLFTPCPFKGYAARLTFNRPVNAYDIQDFNLALPGAKLVLTAPGAAQSAMMFPTDASQAKLIAAYFVEYEPGLLTGVTRLMETGLAAEVQACCRYCSSHDHHERDCTQKRSVREEIHKEYAATTYAAVFRRPAPPRAPFAPPTANRQPQSQQQQPSASASSSGLTFSVGASSALSGKGRRGLAAPGADGFQEVLGRFKKPRIEEALPFTYQRVDDTGGSSPKRKQGPRLAANPKVGDATSTVFTGTRSVSGSVTYQPLPASRGGAAAAPASAHVSAAPAVEPDRERMQVTEMEEDHDPDSPGVSRLTMQPERQQSEQMGVRATTTTADTVPSHTGGAGAMDC